MLYGKCGTARTSRIANGGYEFPYIDICLELRNYSFLFSSIKLRLCLIDYNV